jgi:hypothetical protein
LPGKKAGEPGSCGDDCDDSNPNAHPGGVEICDGVDNDCNGVVDDGMGLVPQGSGVRVSDGLGLATPDGLGYSSRDGTYLVSYTAQVGGRDAFYVAVLDAGGARIGAPIPFTHVGQNTYAGPIVWIGDRFGAAWTDRRDTQGMDTNYEIYFNEVGPDGSKLYADRRVTSSVGFSVGPSLAWTGTEFIAVFQDDGPSGQAYNEIFGQRIGLDATLSGNAVPIGRSGYNQEDAVVAVGAHTIGVAWMGGGASLRRIQAAVLGADLTVKKGPIQLTGATQEGVSPSIVYGQLGYTVAFYDPDGKLPIQGAVIDEQGAVVVPTKPLAKTPGHTRYPTLLSYGDRTVLVYSDDKEKNAGYELYAQILGPRLDPLAGEMRLTTAPGDSVGPVAAFGPAGDVGVVFRDDRDGTPEVYFTRLSCGPVVR